MKYRRLGKTGLRVSVIGMGTWQFGGEWGKVFRPGRGGCDPCESRRTGHQPDRHRRMLRRPPGGESSSAGRSRAEREKWVIATKFGHRFNGPFQRDNLFEPAQVQEQLEQSLKALQTDYIDLYQFHSGTDPMFETPGLWEKLREWVARGTIRHLGISVSKKNASLRQVDRALRGRRGDDSNGLQSHRTQRREGNPSRLSAAESGRPRAGALGQRVLERQIHHGDPVSQHGCPGRVAERGGKTLSRRAGRAGQTGSPRRRADGSVGPGLVPPASGGVVRHPRLQECRAGPVQCPSGRSAERGHRPSLGGRVEKKRSLPEVRAGSERLGGCAAREGGIMTTENYLPASALISAADKTVS